MKWWRWRTRKQWGWGMLAAPVLALLLGATALAQLEKEDSSAQRTATQLQLRAMQASDLRQQLHLLRSLEARLVRAHSLAEVHVSAEHLAEQQLQLKNQEMRYASLLESNADFERLGFYNIFLKDYLGVQQQLLALAQAVDYGSASRIATTSGALLQTYAGASQGHFDAVATILQQWQHDHTAAAQQARMSARQRAERIHSWILWSLASAALLALTLVLAWARAGVQSAGLDKVLSFERGSCTENLCATHSSDRWQGTAVPSQSVAGKKAAPVHLRWSAKPANAGGHHPTRVTPEDWDSF